MKRLADSSCGYRADRSRHTITNILNNEKAHKAISGNFFKRLNYLNNNLYEVQAVKSDLEHQEPIIAGFFILQYAQLRMLELFYNFFDQLGLCNSFEEMEMDTASLYQAQSQHSLGDCIKPEMKEAWMSVRKQNCRNIFSANWSSSFLPRMCCIAHIKYGKREHVLFEEEFYCTGIFFLCSTIYCCFDQNTEKIKFSRKGLNKRTLEETGARLLEKQDRCLRKKCKRAIYESWTPSNTTFCPYIRTQRSLSYFYQRKIVLSVGVHTKTPDIVNKLSILSKLLFIPK